MSKKKKPLGRVTSTSTVHQLATSGLLDALTYSELVVYLRLVGEVERLAVDGRGPVPVKNADLHRDARTAARALAGLQAKGIARVRFDVNRVRTVELT